MTRLHLLACALLLPPTSWAWDIEDGAPAPQIHGRLPEDLRIEHLAIALHGRSVSLDYKGQNHTPVSRASVLHRQSPPFAWQGVAADYPDLHFPEMSLWVNAQHLASKHRVIAWFEDEDVSADLQRAKIDPLLPASGEEALTEGASLHTPRIRRLFSATTREVSVVYPLWQVVYHQAWRVPGLPEGPVSIQLRYEARPDKREVETDSKAFAAAVIGHCGDLEQVKGMLKRADGTLPAAVVMESITVPLALANTVLVDADLIVEPSAKTASALRLGAVLACGPEESSLAGRQSLPRSKVMSRPSLAVLEIFLPS
jgi:hypothetical protein